MMVSKQRVVISVSPEQTKAIAARLAASLQGGEVITLRGDLGAGKTNFTQGLAQGLGVKRHVNSPTFTLIKEYQGERLSLYHMDAYRLDDEWEELGLEEYFYGQGVSVIEWPEKVAAQLPQERLDITITIMGEEQRKLSFQPLNKHYEQLVDEVLL